MNLHHPQLTNCSSGAAPDDVRTVMLLSFNRHGSSLLTARLAEALHGDALPLFELYNSWPFAMLNFYSSELFCRVKMWFAKALVSPQLTRLCDEAPCSHALAGSSSLRGWSIHELKALCRAQPSLQAALTSPRPGAVLEALRNVSTSPVSLGTLLRADPARTFALARGMAAETAHRWLVFKQLGEQFQVEHEIDEGANARLWNFTEALLADPRVVVVRLRRNFFHAYVSNLKILTAGCGSGHSAKEMAAGSSACVPNVSMTDIQRSFVARVRQSARLARACGGLPEAAPFAWRARWSPPRHRRAAVVSLWYEEMEHLGARATVALLRQRLEAAVQVSEPGVGTDSVAAPPYLGCSAAAAAQSSNDDRTTTYIRQDTATNLRDKVANYDQIARSFGGASRAMLCSHAAAGDAATKRACETDREFELPPDQGLSGEAGPAYDRERGAQLSKAAF